MKYELPTSPSLPDIPDGYMVLFVRCFHCSKAYRHAFDLSAVMSVPLDYRWLVAVCIDCEEKPDSHA